MMFSSFSFSFFSRRRGVATPETLAKLEAAALGVACCARGSLRSLAEGLAPCCLSGRSEVDDTGEGFAEVGFGWAPSIVGFFSRGGRSRSRSRVVLARPRSAGLVTLAGVRWDVDLSRAGVAGVGGVGEGRYAEGPLVVTVLAMLCFLVLGGGGGGERCKKLGTKK
jgi:hypothetical protein